MLGTIENMLLNDKTDILSSRPSWATVVGVVALTARDRIRLAAERLIAQRGIDVPQRDITVEAGQRNNSAIQYHFGSRDGLIEAIIENRMAALEARRMELLAERETAGLDDDVRSLVELLVAPMLETPYRQGATHYARFLEQVRTHPAVVAGAAAARPAVRIIMSRLERALDELPRPVRQARLEALATGMFSFLADHERAVESGRVDPAAHDLAAANIVDMLVAIVTAPPSAAAVEAAGRTSARRRTKSA